ncbi:hypothetical protein NSQ77_00005 [Oceanobacillus sp. FSL K6-2867]|uniref:hypothetical protein n=1 Tax=Oceanobacillus sp. FSL K6-2867 TaxID=2954748 RepID=UPI0030DC4942
MDEMNRRTDRTTPAPNHGEHTEEKDFIGIESDSLRNEEFAAELTADDYEIESDDRSMEGATTVYGWIGIALSVISFFMWPVVLGIAGIIFGFVSRSRGADTLGNIAIAAGAVSILITLFILPFF